MLSRTSPIIPILLFSVLSGCAVQDDSSRTLASADLEWDEYLPEERESYLRSTLQDHLQALERAQTRAEWQRRSDGATRAVSLLRAELLPDRAPELRELEQDVAQRTDSPPSFEKPNE